MARMAWLDIAKWAKVGRAQRTMLSGKSKLTMACWFELLKKHDACLDHCAVQTGGTILQRRNEVASSRTAWGTNWPLTRGQMKHYAVLLPSDR